MKDLRDLNDLTIHDAGFTSLLMQITAEELLDLVNATSKGSYPVKGS